ncbi:MAG: hypothetical protein SWY16_23250 [Cyanobacteriota bacterium]|nr:hypothetical protein [Cyanobacteriota bacterium]
MIEESDRLFLDCQISRTRVPPSIVSPLANLKNDRPVPTQIPTVQLSEKVQCRYFLADALIQINAAVRKGTKKKIPPESNGCDRTIGTDAIVVIPMPQYTKPAIGIPKAKNINLVSEFIIFSPIYRCP